LDRISARNSLRYSNPPIRFNVPPYLFRLAHGVFYCLKVVQEDIEVGQVKTNRAE